MDNTRVAKLDLDGGDYVFGLYTTGPLAGSSTGLTESDTETIFTDDSRIFAIGPNTDSGKTRGLLIIVPNSQASNTKKCLRIPKLLDKLLHLVYTYLVNSIFKPCHQARHNARASPSWSY